VVAAFPANSFAATAFFSEEDAEFGYIAGVGEANQVEVTTEAGGEVVRIHDSGAVIVAESGCLSVDPHTVTCPTATGGGVDLGDVADTLALTDTLESFDFVVTGGGGPDTLSSCPMCGGLFFGESGDDTLTGGELVGGNGNDFLTGTAGPDSFDGGLGNDVFTAGAASDHIFPGKGNDTIDAGAGRNDVLDYDEGGGPVTVNVRTGIATTGTGTDTFTGVEDVVGSGSGDLLIGDGKANALSGGLGGPDVIRGGRGADILIGATGTDVLNGGRGSDRLFGGKGHDLLKGEEGSDLLVGGFGPDSLFAGPGDDFLRSHDGRRDKVRGQQGHDRARVDRGLDSVRGVEKLI
jgi:Ca2+-binding RTX toxin-like protein